MSRRTLEPLDPTTCSRFREWSRRFNASLGSPAPGSAWRVLVEKYCIPEDLDWLLFWAVDLISIANKLPDTVTAFKDARTSVLKDIARLKADLRRVMYIELFGPPFWVVFLTSSGKKIRKVAVKFQLCQLMIQQVEMELEGMKLKATVKSMRSLLLSSGEVWLQAYVVGCTHKLYRAQVSVLLETAAAAHGGLDGSVFSEEAVHKRYARYRKCYPTQYKQVVKWLEEFWTQRTAPNGQVDLLPFLLDRQAATLKNAD